MKLFVLLPIREETTAALVRYLEDEAIGNILLRVSIEKGRYVVPNKKMKLLLVSLLISSVSSEPGLLRVPKVYNAVITSNQNLSPSRAYPVIQPVIHRTSIGYVPPFYYTHVAPHLAGPEVVHLPRSEAAENTEKPGGGSFSGKSALERDEGTIKDGDDREEVNEKKNDDSKRKKGKKDGEDQVPISFYPNYQSLYYDPYFYTYNTFNPHLIPGTYYVDYQPFAPVAPIAPIIPKPAYAEQLLPGYGNERKDSNRRRENDERQQIPDVPPPPVPTSSKKNSR
ncbi:hypothetical protein KPH14_009721 [Odynerus spinipes]|uniref:Uncharacterized protein n=1 Tax=Odynerus spinipes TaxID=1348599 RepID=A0AAD9RR37_9HYME|nr:hypothetical protein KPH14_009721 [Odynerus spinipes]